MSLPTKKQLDNERLRAEKRLARLQSSYKEFLTASAKLEKKETELWRELTKHTDKAKVYHILQKIHSIKD